MNTQLLAAKIASAIPLLAQDCVVNNEHIIKMWLDEELERDMALQEEADKERLIFLRRLDESEVVNVSDWEAHFIESQISAAVPQFSPKQREVIDKLIDKYGSRIGWSV